MERKVQRGSHVGPPVIDSSVILMFPSDLLGLMSVLMISVIGEPTGN